jgi:predicted nicotinamide N-methyase
MSFLLHLQQFAVDESLMELFVPDAGAVKKAWQSGDIPFPYWSQVWPSAKALATFLVQQPSFVRDKTVLELGAGLGLPSLVAARFAAQVRCTDYAPEAVDIAAASAAEAGLKNMTASVLDWQHLPPGLHADVLLLSDINYVPEAFAQLSFVIAGFLSQGTTVLLSTPQRLMAKDFLVPLLADCQQQKEIEVSHEGKNVVITVMVLKKINNK